jgi:pyridoxal biosynthesis lyase PdxS
MFLENGGSSKMSHLDIIPKINSKIVILILLKVQVRHVCCTSMLNLNEARSQETEAGSEVRIANHTDY